MLLLGECASLRAGAVRMGFKGMYRARHTHGGVGDDAHLQVNLTLDNNILILVIFFSMWLAC